METLKWRSGRLTSTIEGSSPKLVFWLIRLRSDMIEPLLLVSIIRKHLRLVFLESSLKYLCIIRCSQFKLLGRKFKLFYAKLCESVLILEFLFMILDSQVELNLESNVKLALKGRSSFGLGQPYKWCYYFWPMIHLKNKVQQK